MFYGTGYNSTILTLDVSKWNVDKVTNMSSMFRLATMYNVTEEDVLKEVSLENVKFDLMYQKALDLVTTNKEDK